MIVIRVLLQVKPELRTAFLAYIAGSAAQSREFDGCMNFGYYASVDDDSYFLLHEEWASQAQFDAYKSSDTFAEIGQNIFPMLDGKPDAAYFTVDMLESA